MSLLDVEGIKIFNKKSLATKRKAIIFVILFILLFISMYSIDILADNQLDYVSGSNFEKTRRMETTLQLKRGEYELIVDGSALFGPPGQIFRPIPGNTKVKVTLYNSSDVLGPSGETTRETTSRIMINDSINTVNRIELGFFVPTDLYNVIIELESDREISGAIFEENNISSINKAQIISFIRLIPYLGMIAIFSYGIYTLTIGIINRSIPYRKTVDKKKIL